MQCVGTSVLAILVSLLCAEAAPKARPNVVFILADDYGYNDIGYHARDHGSDLKTPNLDQMARDGIKLENYYVQSICTPTRSQLMTGRYQIHTGLQHGYIHPDQSNGLPLENKILPEQMKNCGYDTHMVGKWHLGDFKNEYLPWNRGFNSYFGFLTGSEDYYTKNECWGNDGCGVDMWNSTTGPDNTTWGQYSAHLYTEKAIGAIDRRDKRKPFFLYLAFQSVHSPLQVPEEYMKPFSHIKDKARRTYAGMVAALDEAVGNLTKYLEKSGLLDNTIIVFSTDNGGQTLAGGNNWPLRGRKTTLWEGGVKGVGFMFGKPLGVAGIVHKQLLHVSDWLPTILSAASCPLMNGTLNLDGYDQMKALLQQAITPRRDILHNIDPLFPRPVEGSVIHSSGFDTTVHAALRSGPWKLLTGDPGFAKWVPPPESNSGFTNQSFMGKATPLKLVQLFHIEDDPYEKNDLSELFPSIVDKLMQKLVAYNRTAVPVLYPAPDHRAYPKYNNGFWGPWLN